MKILDTGCHAVAHAVKSARVDMVAAYPITPQTSVVEAIASMVDRGELDARFLSVEGEHSAAAAVVAGSAAGARVFTATASQGLLYMHEVLHMAAGGRFPVVMACVNRAVYPPWSIYVDHQDTLAQRDTGWIQIYCASVQEIYNAVIQAYRIGEETRLPVMVCFDGFILSHCMMPFEVPAQEIIDRYLPEFVPGWTLDPAHPSTYGNVTGQDDYAIYREQFQQALEDAHAVIIKAAEEYRDLTGMWDGDFFKPYRTEDASIFVLSMGSMGDELELSVDSLREAGMPVGALRLRVFRPFPSRELVSLIPDGATLVVLDRNYAFGTGGGTILGEVKAAFYGSGKTVRILGEVMGIGGQDLTHSFMAERIRALVEG